MGLNWRPRQTTRESIVNILEMPYLRVGSRGVPFEGGTILIEKELGEIPLEFAERGNRKDRSGARL